MTTNPVPAASFLKKVWCTHPFAEFCRQHGIVPGRHPTTDSWMSSLKTLPHAEQTRVGLCLAKVGELARAGVEKQILEAAGGIVPPADVLDGPAVLLWYLVHHRRIFEDFYFRHRIESLPSWRHARAEGAVVLQETAAAEALREELRRFLKIRDGTDGYCLVERQTVGNSFCFQCSYGDRIRLLEEFSESGAKTCRPARLAREIVFVYRPVSETISLKSPIRSRPRVLELFQIFGRTVLGLELPEACLQDVYNLEPLKRAPPLLPDERDMQCARVRSLVLEHPREAGGGRLRLEIDPRNGADAITRLLQTHVPRVEELEALRVVRAEISVRLSLEGRSKEYVISLTPNSCSLDESPAAARFRRCLQAWGLAHGHHA